MRIEAREKEKKASWSWRGLREVVVHKTPYWCKSRTAKLGSVARLI